jgi:hypothetical protein
MSLPEFGSGLYIAIGGLFGMVGLALLATGVNGLLGMPLNRALARIARDLYLGKISFGAFILLLCAAIYVEVFKCATLGMALFAFCGIALSGGLVAAISMQRQMMVYARWRQLTQREPPPDA